ncbi:hypothetical protein F4813DRAFT_362185 [Daldinia decipiens]|uniref:uncharacterized protein n=1 Tax=Daldinia decipiens TaxID=326647 RepID=UPI0020C4DFAD|nr:uncharacterized protein F4813DRAFT_362185 [Daldinia decipiens]KAI1656892.1 hypothetical protein F4813DRAFT_362185 [Daldinia decipiens]
MKRQHIALPTLQVAAAAFFAASVQAETYCVDGATKVVATAECATDNANAHAIGQFFLHQGPPGLTVGDVIPPPAEPGHVSGGFGRRSADNCDPDKDKNCNSGG